MHCTEYSKRDSPDALAGRRRHKRVSEVEAVEFVGEIDTLRHAVAQLLLVNALEAPGAGRAIAADVSHRAAACNVLPYHRGHVSRFDEREANVARKGKCFGQAISIPQSAGSSSSANGQSDTPSHCFARGTVGRGLPGDRAHLKLRPAACSSNSGRRAEHTGSISRPEMADQNQRALIQLSDLTRSRETPPALSTYMPDKY